MSDKLFDFRENVPKGQLSYRVQKILSINISIISFTIQ